MATALIPSKFLSQNSYIFHLYPNVHPSSGAILSLFGDQKL